MVNWDQWQTLLAVTRFGTYAEAGRALKIDATTVSRRIRHLEKVLGFDLFSRDNDKLVATNKCEPILASIEAAAEAIRKAEQKSALDDGATVWRDLRLTAAPFLITSLFAPNIEPVAHDARLRVELIGTASNRGLHRREADIAIRIEDQARELNLESRGIAAEPVGTLSYAVFCHAQRDPETLPWAGLVDDYDRSTGSEAMIKLAGQAGFRFRAYHFETLREFAGAGVARTLLPCFIGRQDSRLVMTGPPILAQPLWMQYHLHDQDVTHLRAARAWIKDLAQKIA
ncbi:MAG: LysR family transcriptional regulator [Pseudomonadota bacterium]